MRSNFHAVYFIFVVQDGNVKTAGVVSFPVVRLSDCFPAVLMEALPGCVPQAVQSDALAFCLLWQTNPGFCILKSVCI